MLLKDLIKQTDSGHPDFTFLTKSHAEMEVIAVHVNDSKKVAESNLKLIEIQTKVKRCPRIVDPARIFVRRYVSEGFSSVQFLSISILCLVNNGRMERPCQVILSHFGSFNLDINTALRYKFDCNVRLTMMILRQNICRSVNVVVLKLILLTPT